MDSMPILIWWLIIFIFGLVGWPLAFSLLRFLPDRGFAFVRPIGFLVGGYILWLGATFRLLQNNVGGIVLALGLTLGIGFLWYRQQVRFQQGATILNWLKREWRYVLGVELLFNVAFFGWVIFKAYNPNIETAGGEKWMEIAFINGILRSGYFPPQDPWLSGFGISYYYFGYVLMASATQLTGLISTIAFNLYIPTLFAMTLAGAFGIVANLVALYQSSDRRSDASGPRALGFSAAVTGLVGALFVGLMGNLIGVLEVLHKRGLLPAEFWVWLDIRDLKNPPVGAGRTLIPENFTWWQGGLSPADIQANVQAWIPDRFIWWWRGSRVLTDYTLSGREQEVIDEFPFFSFLLGDVHPHVLALPFVLLVTALALNLIVNPARDAAAAQAQGGQSLFSRFRALLKSGWLEILRATGGRLGFGLYALAIGGLSFLNTWDFPIYLAVVGLAFTVWLAQHRSDWPNTLWPAIVGTVWLGTLGIILYLPFYVTFQSQASGILPNLWNPTRLPQFFVFFGPFLVAVIVLLIVLSGQDNGWKRYLSWTGPLMILGPLLVLLLVLASLLVSPAGRDYIQGVINNPEVYAVLGDTTVGALVQEAMKRRAVNPWTVLLLGGLLGWTMALLINFGAPRDRSIGRRQNYLPNWPIEKFVLILLVVGLGLPLIVEFVYLRDNFGIRMNTIFKFYFQAWVLLALASAFAVYYVSQQLKGIPAYSWRFAMTVLVLGAMVYPILATMNKTNSFRNEPTLDGIEWISQQRPGDYAAITWLRENAFDGSVILEAPGSNYAAYQYTGRVSAMTGLPTLLGWGGHQSQWRGNYDEPARREPEIDLLFNTSDVAQAQLLLDKYGITYVYVGLLERERYSPQGLRKFEQMMTIAFQQDDVTIYKR